MHELMSDVKSWILPPSHKESRPAIQNLSHKGSRLAHCLTMGPAIILSPPSFSIVSLSPHGCLLHIGSSGLVSPVLSGGSTPCSCPGSRGGPARPLLGSRSTRGSQVHLRVGGMDEIHDGSDQRRSDQARLYPEKPEQRRRDSSRDTWRRGPERQLWKAEWWVRCSRSSSQLRAWWSFPLLASSTSGL